MVTHREICKKYCLSCNKTGVCMVGLHGWVYVVSLHLCLCISGDVLVLGGSYRSL